LKGKKARKKEVEKQLQKVIQVQELLSHIAVSKLNIGIIARTFSDV
jgi:hypothetical protein